MEKKNHTIIGFITFIVIIFFVYLFANFSGTAEERAAKAAEKEEFTSFAQHCAELIIENYGNIVRSRESYNLGYVTYYFEKAHCKIGESANIKDHCKYECQDY